MTIYSIWFFLLSTAVTLRRDISILFSRVAIIVLLYSFIIALANLYLTYIDRGIGLFGGLFQTTGTTLVFHMFIFILSVTILQLTGFYPRKVWVADFSSIKKLLFYNFNYYNTKIKNKMGEQFKIIEYPLIILFILTGAMFLISTSDLVSVFLSIELQSYGLYLLCALHRNSEQATSGGLTYFLLGGLSSCFILLGSSLLYTNSGSTNLDGIYVITNLSDISDLANGLSTNTLNWYESHYISYSLLILSVGFLFKVSAAPFHFWSPDVYDSIPTLVTTFVAIIAKISIFIFFLDLVHYTSNSFFAFELSWTSSLLVSSLLSLIIGSVLGLTQSRIKRLFAYSTISHVGFILLALSINSLESIQAFIFYLMQYSVTNLNAFIILISVGYSLYFYINKTEEFKHLLDKKNSPIQLISQLKGYFYINPFIALSFTITIFSFVGIPPLIGFFAKQMVLSAALDSGYVFLALIAILTSVISAVYYLNVVKEIFFYQPIYEFRSVFSNVNFHGSITKNNVLIQKLVFNIKNITLSSSLSITISLLTYTILLFIFVPQVWLSMANVLALILFNP